jgi:hypothetical protein
MFAVLAHYGPSESVTWWGPFATLEAADEFVEAAGEFVECIRVELTDPDRAVMVDMWPVESAPS